jgi:hypothetical protein
MFKRIKVGFQVVLGLITVAVLIGILVSLAFWIVQYIKFIWNLWL